MKKILIIEDERDTVMVLKKALENEGHEVIVAYDGADGFKKITTHKPEIILLDLMLPKLDGISLETKLRENPETANIPVIIITGRGELREFIQMKEAINIKAYLEKPFPLSLLLKKIKEIA